MPNPIFTTEALSRALIANLPGGATFVVDRNLRYLLAEGEALATAGFKPEDFMGRTIFEVLPPDLAASYEPMYRQALAGEPFEHEHQAHEHTYISRGTPLRTDSGEVYAVLVVSYDISERKRVEDERKRAEAAIAADLANEELLRKLAVRLISEENVTTIYDEILSATITIARADAGTIQIYDPQTKSLELIASQNFSRTITDYFHHVDASSRTACGIAMNTGQRAFVDFPDEVADFGCQLLINEGIQAALALPLVSRTGTPLGMLNAHWRETRHRPSDRELRFLDLLARQAADLIEQRQAEATLRESEARLQSIANLVPDLLWDSEPSGSTNWYNQRWMEYTGQTFEQAICRGWTNVIHPDDQEGSARHYQEAVEQGIPLQQEHRIRRHDGAYRWFVVKASPLKDESGKVIKMYGAATDIHEQRVALEALRASEVKYRTLFEAIDEGFAIYELKRDENGNVVDMLYRETNEAYERLTGLTNVVGRWASELVPNLEPSWFEKNQRVADTGIPIREEDYIADLDRWFSVHHSCVGGAGSNLIAAVFDNITDRKQREQQQAFLLKFSDALRTEPDVDAIANRAIQMLIEQLQLDRSYITTYYLEDNRADLNYQIGNDSVPPLPDYFVLSDYPEAFKTTFEGTLVIEDDWERQGLSEAERRNSRNLGMRAMVAATLRKENYPLWSMVAISSVPRRWTSAEIKLVEEVAERTWAAIERAKAEDTLRESEAKYRSLFESMNDGFCIIELIYNEQQQPIDYRFLEANSAFERQSGLSDPLGKTGLSFAPNHDPELFANYQQALVMGEPIEFEIEMADLGRYYRISVNRHGDLQKKQLAIVFNDITDRKNRELNVAFLDEIGKELSRLSAPDEIIQTVGAHLGEFLQASGCIFADVDEAKNEATIHHGWNTADVASLKQTFRLADYFGEEFSRAGRAGEAVIVCNTGHDERANAEAYARLQIGSFVTVPFQRHGRWVANITVTSREPREWRVDEIELLREIASRVFPRIERARAEADLRESEAKYRSLFDTIDEGFAIAEVIYDDSGQPVDILYLEANLAASRLTGVPDLTQQRLSELSPDWETDWAELYDRVAQSGISERTERYATPFQRWYDFFVFRLEAAAESSNRRVAVIFQDITDRKRAEEHQAFLLKLSDALRAESNPDSVGVLATQMLAQYMEVERCHIIRLSLAQGLGWVGPECHAPDLPHLTGEYRYADFPIVMHRLETEPLIIHDLWNDSSLPETDKQSIAAMGMQAALTCPLRKGARDTIWALNVGDRNPRTWSEHDRVLVEEAAERIWAAIERAKAEAAMREAELQRVREQSAREQERQRAESLVELDRAKTLFFSNVSHEFRTPLTLSLAPLQDALSDRTHPLDPVHRERLELVHCNSLRLLKLVNTLLDFSRIEAGRMEAVYEPTDLATFTAELSSVFRSAIERAGLQLIVDCPPLPEPVFVDREMWEKIVLNLLSNAFKFTFEGEIRVSLHSTDRNQAVLQIQDTGAGIAPEHLPHLFERFYQVRGTQARTHEGSGIGLALVHELVRLQGGTIEVSSTVGEGTCFTIALPFGTDHLPSDRLHFEGDRPAVRTLASTAMGATAYVEEAERWLPEGNGEEISIPTSYSLLPTPPSARVLVIDDNADMREYLTRILCDHVQVEAVADGTAALAAVQAQVPNLIVSDVMMPGLDGFELLQALRADSRTREIPIILLSARAGEEAIVEGLEAGADDYLIKPFSAQELISRVTAHLQTAQLRGEALQEARSTLRSRDEFISVVSHELNTPLVSILGWTRMLRSSPSNPVMLNKALDTIERNATLQGKLVQDLLDLSRITAGKLRLNPQPIELQPVIETAIATVTQSAAEKGINLTWQEPVTEPVVVMGDGDRLSQVLINLLTNAIKFTPESGSVTLELSVVNNDNSADDSYAEIRVTDTGIGIAAEFLPHVFDRFRQAEEAHSAKGLGLGLAIAHHIVELHDGTIHADSAGEGQGATFTVRLPLLQNSES
ncbi:ATP-binding protein [Leptolyngbya ohadii]|uniref:ATP-binding protein n=1 Tax=Leptolyngbya ohadii TaxID=1962290 RepID=UPI001CED6B32|nr:ATP-binding protein [Leptolyngbya ohadii]